MLDRFRRTAAAPLPSAIYQIHLELGAGAFVIALAALGALGALFAQRRASACDVHAQPSDTADPLSHSPHKKASPSAPTTDEDEAELQERIAKLKHLEEVLHIANAQQIVALYHQLQHIALNTFALTDMEQRIALAAINGESTPNIAKDCMISESMVKHHLSAIFKKTGTTSRTELRETVQRITTGDR